MGQKKEGRVRNETTLWVLVTKKMARLRVAKKLSSKQIFKVVELKLKKKTYVVEMRS